MAKHDFESDTMTPSQYMHCVRVYMGVGLDGITTVGLANFDSWTNYEVPTRPTGAHRHETVPVDTATYIYATFVECVRDPTPGMMEFEFIDIPRV